MSTTTSSGKLASVRTGYNNVAGELDRYKLLVETIEDYEIIILDDSGFIQTWNKGAKKNKGYSAEEIIGKHFSVFYLPYDIQAKKPEHALELAKKYSRVEDEDWRVRKDGSKYWANVVITALHDPGGKLTGFVKVTRNLTERKQHEVDIRRANIALKQQLRDLEALNISKDEFVSLASHQLRTPATVIKQLLGLLVEGYIGPLTKECQDMINKAYESNERQLAIVNSLLKVAQLDAGKVILKKTLTDVHGLLKCIVEEHADTFSERGQRYYLEIAEGCTGKALLDSEHFRMAIENIVDNASKYTPVGGEIRISSAKAGDSLRISVKDTGVGIAPEYMDKLFVRFSRIPNELPQTTPGSGLGLYWANKVVGLHGGKIEVESVLDKGTEFHVFVPGALTRA